ncbi:MAG: hypothetical protein M3Q53_01290 [Actinomycetota bacterium]|nr:hypothetical protein [Actinomycetota bacterium]
MAAPQTVRAKEGGQATPEYVGLVLLVATAFASMLALAGSALPGGGLTRAVASKLVCAVKTTGECGAEAAALAAQPTPLERRYGAELAALIAGHVPTISFEDDDFVSLPVDPRECRERSCADSIRHGSLEHTQTGLQPTAFTHVVDCRDSVSAGEEGFDCSGERAGRVYVQLWLYYPQSWTRTYQRWGFHEDDWESYQLRIAPDGTAVARASSHHGYNGRGGGIASIGSDLGKTPSTGWDAILGQLHVAAGSHAGMSQSQEGDSRRIEPANLRLIPLEPVAAAGNTPPFAVTPPWMKAVWSDPEAMGT